ncbi:hypothetical protein Tco_1557480, partial [Tanacetum coccineum]
GYHAVPPLYTGNYMPSRPDLYFVGLDDSVYKTNVSETITNWESDSDDDYVFRLSAVQTKPKFINFVNSGEHVKLVNKENTPRQEEYPRKSQSPRSNRRNLNGIMTQKLGDGFEYKKKTCFVCGSVNHLIKDCNFSENKMVGKSVLNNKVLTKSGNVPFNTAKQSFPRAEVSNSTARYVNTAASRPTVNVAKPSLNVFNKSHSPVRRSFHQKSAVKTNSFNKTVNTVRFNNVTTAGPKAVVSAAKGNGENAVKSSTC